MTAPDPSVALDELLAHRAWVRTLALALSRDEHEAADVEQATWVAALESPPSHRTSLRGWLGTTARHALSRLRRSERRRVAHETAATPRDNGDGRTDASALAARADAHRRVVEALVGLDEPYRRTLLLRYFDGLAVAEVAARTGVPLETARARLRRGIAKLRTQLEGEFGGRETFAVALGWLGRGDGTGCVGASAAGAAGGVVMGAKLWAALALVAVAAGGTWWALRTPTAPAAPPDVAAWTGTVAAPVQNPQPRTAPPRAEKPVAPTPRAESPKVTVPEPPSSAEPEKSAQERLDAAQISASWSDVPCLDVVGEISAAAGVEVYVERATLDALSKSRASMEFDRGPAAVILGMVAGLASLTPDVQAKRIVLVAAGGAAPDESSLVRVPTTRTGPDGKPEQIVFVVLDERSVAVEGAEVWIATPPSRRATTNVAGEATIDRPLASPEWFARKAGYVDAAPASAKAAGRLELRLGGAAARIEGVVRSRTGAGVAGARVIIWRTVQPGRAAPSTPHDHRTAADGSFADASVPPGRVTVDISATGFAAVRTELDAAAGPSPPLDVVLAPECVCSGTVRDAAGTAVPIVRIEVRRQGADTATGAMTRKDGTFRVGALAAGQVTVTAFGRRGQSLATTTLTLVEGETATWDPVVDPAAK
ncbi:MAG: sigma-70 family RNA polymerase sigma factor [Planctomycetes bacterium]|nr:sigma-70 family RNA polymerase sigma factor [Planctomycetota bacterium]